MLPSSPLPRHLFDFNRGHGQSSLRDASGRCPIEGAHYGAAAAESTIPSILSTLLLLHQD